MNSIAHIINPFKAATGSDLQIVQPITFESMRKAKAKAQGKVEVELLSTQYVEDEEMVPGYFKKTPNLLQSVLDAQNFNKKIKLPFIADILERLYNESSADYLIYTNVDIGLYEDFYLIVNEFINSGLDAFIINRRRLPFAYTSISDLPAIYSDRGKSHPGFDCFVFHRNIYPRLKLEGICIGVPFLEISFSQNLFALSDNFKLFENEILTFHIGEEIFKKRAPKEYFIYNRKKFHTIEHALFEKMNLKKFPYSQQLWITRFIKWALHPCIPIRLIVKLLFKECRKFLA